MDSNSRDYDIKYHEAVKQPDGSWLHDDGDVYWYNEAGQIHRDDGPASISITGRVRLWVIHGNAYDFDDWLKVTPITDEQRLLLRLQYA
jgi:hypothetical protein